MAQSKDEGLTEDERRMLQELHTALMKTPPGSSGDTRPLIEDIRNVVKAYHRASWVTRAIIWLLPTAALLGASANSIIDFVRKWTG